MTTGMSAPPIGTMMSTPSASETSVISQKTIGALGEEEDDDQHDQRDGERDVDDVALRQQDRLAATCGRRA